MTFLLYKLSIDELEDAQINGVLKKWVLGLFDHWLTESEAEEQIISYATIKTIDKQSEYILLENRFKDFFSKLHNQYPLQSRLWSQDDNDYKPISSLKQYLSNIENSLREETFIDVYIPALNIVLSGSYDLNVIIYAQNAQDIATIKKIAEENKLHLLKV